MWWYSEGLHFGGAVAQDVVHAASGRECVPRHDVIAGPLTVGSARRGVRPFVGRPPASSSVRLEVDDHLQGAEAGLQAE